MHIGVNASKEQLAYLAKVPFPASVLEACKDTHVLVAVFPLSLLDIRGICKGERLLYRQDWYDNQAFAKEKGEVGRQLIRKTPVNDSTSKTWDEQSKLLGKDEEVPSVRAVVYTMIGENGERLFENIYVRCSDLDSGCDRVHVGRFDAGGLGVSGSWDDSRVSYLGLSAARKS